MHPQCLDHQVVQILCQNVRFWVILSSCFQPFSPVLFIAWRYCKALSTCSCVWLGLLTSAIPLFRSALNGYGLVCLPRRFVSSRLGAIPQVAYLSFPWYLKIWNRWGVHFQLRPHLVVFYCQNSDTFIPNFLSATLLYFKLNCTAEIAQSIFLDCLVRFPTGARIFYIPQHSDLLWVPISLLQNRCQADNSLLVPKPRIVKL